jgi:coenzyme F420-dependent glucose-6-phosphate dehydrogenase
MGIADSIRGLVWAHRRTPGEVQYLLALAHERFQPDELLQQSIEAERAGFDAVCCSDHLEPWWAPDAPTPAACGNAWVWLGAVGNSTSRVSLGTAVTGAIHRYNPVVLAQQVATLEQLNPGRAFLGVGSSEAMNEIPAGLVDWPSPSEQLQRTEEALTIVTRLLDGETVDFSGDFFTAKRARLYLKNARRPPVYLSAFNEGAAELAGRLADGVWTLGDPKQAPGVIEAYRRGCEQAGREPGEIVLQTLISWAETDEVALNGSREWKATLVDEHYTDAIADPVEIGRNGEQIPDEEFEAMSIVSSDPDTHVKKLQQLEALGATAVCVMNCSGADPLGTIRTYGESVLPALRK